MPQIVRPWTWLKTTVILWQLRRNSSPHTLKMVLFASGNKILDVGGGNGSFAIELVRKFTNVSVDIFDLPQVKSAAEAHLSANGFRRGSVFGLGLRDEPLPWGYDAITLIRVLYDIRTALLWRSCSGHMMRFRRRSLIVSEPMSGGDRPHRAGDVYFAFYTMAMRTGMRSESNSEMCKSRISV